MRGRGVGPRGEPLAMRGARPQREDARLHRRRTVGATPRLYCQEPRRRTVLTREFDDIILLFLLFIYSFSI